MRFSSLVVVLSCVLAIPRLALAETPTLEERVKALEIKTEDKAAAGGDKSIGFWFDGGLRFGSADGSVAGHLGGHVITHYFWHPRLNESDGQIDGFTIESAAIDAQCRLWETWEVLLRAHVAPDGADLYYGWVEFNRWEEFKIRTGLFKEPFSQEETEDEKWVDLPEHGLTTLTVPGLNLGIEMRGTLFDGIFKYALGVFNGTTLVDAAGLNGDSNSDKDIAARIELRPAAKTGIKALQGLMVGVDATRGRQGDNEFLAGLTHAKVTDTNFHQGSFAGVDSDGILTRACLNVEWIWGPLSVKGEAIYFKSKLEINDRHEVLRGSSYSLFAGFWLLGSTRRTGFRPELKPKSLFAGGFGDVQLMARWAKTRFGDTLEEKAGWTGSRSAEEFSVGVNWYPNPHVRITAAYIYYRYDEQGSRRFLTPNGRRWDHEDTVMLRAQIDF